MSDHAFDGIRIADFSWVGVGPLVAKYLADHGAETIRLESGTRPEALRRAPPFVGDEPGLDNSGYYANFNSSKLCAGLNMGHPRAVDLAKRIIAQSDIVTESFTPKAMRAWGLTYDDLRDIKPDIIMISMPLYGQTGPWSMYQGYGHVLQGAAGISHMTGYRDGEPIGTGLAYTDFFVPHLAAITLIAALDHRERTGEGQFIDFGQLEAAVYATETLVLDYTVNGRQQHRQGNRHPMAAPHGAFRCAPRADTADGRDGDSADERWIAIACFDDNDWHSLCTVLGDDSLRWDDRFNNQDGRLINQDDLESALAQHTRHWLAEELMQALQESGVAAGVVQNSEDLRNDPQLAHRQHYWTLDHPTMGPCCYDGPSFRLSHTPGELIKAAPTLGADTAYVWKTIVGLTDEEFTELLVEGAFD